MSFPVKKIMGKPLDFDFESYLCTESINETCN